GDPRAVIRTALGVVPGSRSPSGKPHRSRTPHSPRMRMISKPKPRASRRSAVPAVAHLLVLALLGAFALPAAARADDPPPGFRALFNGKDFTGWIGVPHFDPRQLDAMEESELAAYLETQWKEVEKHWRIEDGAVVNDGHGPYLTTKEKLVDIELLLEYRTVPRADSGIYLRMNP